MLAPPCGGFVQAWFPMHAELWNAPTWFLSALTFAMMVLAYALEPMAKMTKKSLKMCIGALTGVMLVAKAAYSYDLNLWTALDGMLTARTHPNLAFGNLTRFHPFYAVVEVLIGVAACRLVMLDGTGGDKVRALLLAAVRSGGGEGVVGVGGRESTFVTDGRLAARAPQLRRFRAK